MYTHVCIHITIHVHILHAIGTHWAMTHTLLHSHAMFKAHHGSVRLVRVVQAHVVSQVCPAVLLDFLADP